MPTEKHWKRETKTVSLLGEHLFTIPVDPKAREEERNIIAKSRRLRREEHQKHWAFVILLWLTIGLFSIALTVKVLQFLLPEELDWLTEKQSAQLNDFLTTGIISGAVVGILQRKTAQKEEA